MLPPLKNKGLFLETVLNLTHQRYFDNQQALVNKIPTNIKLVKKGDQKSNQPVFSTGRNCDYVGVYHGTYFEFEAKETQQAVFKAQMIRKNQVQELDAVLAHQGLAFLIVYFVTEERFFLIEWRLLKSYFQEHQKTIPFEWFIEYGHELQINHHLCLDYLPILSHLTNYT